MWLRKADNVGVLHGAWGEAVAVDHLRRHGYEIVDRNSRPVERDERLEIDIVAWDRRKDAMSSSRSSSTQRPRRTRDGSRA